MYKDVATFFSRDVRSPHPLHRAVVGVSFPSPIGVGDFNILTHVTICATITPMKKMQVGALILLWGIFAHPVGAFMYTQDNINTTYHETPFSFTVTAEGEAFGLTLSGMAFSQTNITTIPGVRMQRFVIGAASWYVSDHGVIWADTDLEALSIYLSLA